MTKVCVIGAGHIGSVLAAVLAEAGLDVTAIDIDQRRIDGFLNGSVPIAEPGLQEIVDNGLEKNNLAFTTDFAPCADADVILVTVGTPLADDLTPDLSHVQTVAGQLEQHVRDGQLIMVKSTVPPGTTRDVFADHLRKAAHVHVAFSPERLAEGAAIREAKELPIVVGGIDPESTTKAAEFWRSALKLEVIEVASPESAEMVKLADNLWIDLNIALAHDLAKLCDALPYPLDVLEVIQGANSLKKGQHYVNILTPSNGVGGYCLTKDPWFVDALGKWNGAELLTPATSRRVNDSMPAYCVGQIAEYLKTKGVDNAQAKVAVLGYAFKTNSGDVRLTPVQPFLDALEDAGIGEVAVYDPMVLEHDAERAGIELRSSAEDAMKDADCVAFLVGHDEIRSIDAQAVSGAAKDGALVFDGRMYFSPEEIASMRDHGLAYQGVGR